jgi:hypothetical protein
VLDKHITLKDLLLNLEMGSVFMSYDPQCFQTILSELQHSYHRKSNKRHKVKTRERQIQCQLCHKIMWGMPFSTPNAKSAQGLSKQAELGETTTQENSNGKIG